MSAIDLFLQLAVDAVRPHSRDDSTGILRLCLCILVGMDTVVALSHTLPQCLGHESPWGSSLPGLLYTCHFNPTEFEDMVQKIHGVVAVGVMVKIQTH